MVENLFNAWKITIPKYDDRFKKTLFDVLSKKGGGSEDSRINLGKYFSNNYELYIYAFFLGLYNDKCIDIPEDTKKQDFSHAIQHWGSKSNRLDRKDFTIIQEYIFMALFSKIDIDIVNLEKGKITEASVVKQLRRTMESYTNGGLILLEASFKENKLSVDHTFFLDMILSSTISEKISFNES